MLIRAYGVYWNPSLVNWGSGKLLGRIKRDRTSHEIDFWNARGVYLLQHEFKTVYVGKASQTSIGSRLAEHTEDRFAGRWDMFSWFSISKPNITYGNVALPGWRSASRSTITATLEAFAILVSDPPLNRRRERVPDAEEAQQAVGRKIKTVRGHLHSIEGDLKVIRRRLAEIVRKAK